MPFSRKELFYIKDFDFQAVDPKRKSATPENKFLIVLDNIENNMGIFCITASLRGKTASLIPPKLTENCQAIEEGHFFTFSDNAVCADYTFDVKTFVRGFPGDVFEESVATLHQAYSMKDKAKKLGTLTHEHFMSVLSCLCESEYLDRKLRKRLREIAEEEAKKVASAKS
jgi:hypothetical protein